MRRIERKDLTREELSKRRNILFFSDSIVIIIYFILAMLSASYFIFQNKIHLTILIAIFSFGLTAIISDNNTIRLKQSVELRDIQDKILEGIKNENTNNNKGKKRRL